MDRIYFRPDKIVGNNSLAVLVHECNYKINTDEIVSYEPRDFFQFITPHDIVFHGVDKSFGFCTTVPNPLLSTMQSLFMEFFCTFFLVFMVCGAFDPRSNSQPDTLPIKFSFAIVGIVLTAVNTRNYNFSLYQIHVTPKIFQLR